jgi:hypothetical protein
MAPAWGSGLFFLRKSDNSGDKITLMEERQFIYQELQQL